MGARAVWAALGVLAVFGMVEGLPPARSAEAIDKAVFVLDAENVVVEHSAVKPEIRVGTDDVVCVHARGPRVVASPWFRRFAGSDDSVCRGQFCGDVINHFREGWSDNNIAAHLLQNGRRLPVVAKNKFDTRRLGEALVEPIERSGTENFHEVLARDSYEDMGPLGLCEGDGGLLGCIGGTLSNGNRSFRVSRLFGGVVEEPNGEDRQDAVEKDEQPVGQVIVPVTFLVSFIGMFLAAKVGGRIAGWFVGVVSLGWLGVIVYYGGLL